MFHDPSKLGTLHDSFCRCRTCKPPLVGEATAVRRARNVTILALASLGLWVGVAASTFLATR